MSPTQDTTLARVGEVIKQARVSAGYSQSRLASAIGSHANTIGKIEAGEIKYSRFFQAIESVLKINIMAEWSRAGHVPPVAYFEPSTQTSRHHPGSGGHDPLPPPLFTGKADLPVYQTIPMGRDAMLLMDGPVEHTARLAILMQIKAAYALRVTSDAMSPVYRVGDVVQLHPHLPPEVGREAVLYTRPDQSTDKKKVMLAYLAAVDDKAWTLEQFDHGTTRKFKLTRAEILECHIIVGKQCRWTV